MTKSTDERRRFPRRSLRTPIGIDTEIRKNRVGVTANVSAGGMLVQSSSRLPPGRQVSVVFRSQTTANERAQGRVVRAFVDTDMRALFPYVAAIEFDQPLARLPVALRPPSEPGARAKRDTDDP